MFLSVKPCFVLRVLNDQSVNVTLLSVEPCFVLLVLDVQSVDMILLSVEPYFILLTLDVQSSDVILLVSDDDVLSVIATLLLGKGVVPVVNKSLQEDKVTLEGRVPGKCGLELLLYPSVRCATDRR